MCGSQVQGCLPRALKVRAYQEEKSISFQKVLPEEGGLRMSLSPCGGPPARLQGQDSSLRRLPCDGVMPPAERVCLERQGHPKPLSAITACASVSVGASNTICPTTPAGLNQMPPTEA